MLCIILSKTESTLTNASWRPQWPSLALAYLAGAALLDGARIPPAREAGSAWSADQLAEKMRTGNGRVTECKLVLLGDSNVGKSSLVLRFVKNQFNADQVTTVGAAFLQSPVPLDDSDDKIQFGIWDTAGSERYKALAPMYYRGAEAAIVVYDITSFESFEGAKSWVRELKLYGQPNVVVALAANKCDLEQYRAVSTHEGQAYARENELTYFETSAKTAHNVRRMFVELAQRVPRKDASAHPSNANLNSSAQKQGGCAC